MIEVRRIRDCESGTFLELLCGVFHLDQARAKPVFYDPVLYDLNRKWALFNGGEMCSILTTTGLRFGWGACIGIAGVATRPSFERRGYAQRLLETVLEAAEADGEGPAMLFAHKQTLYKRVGFSLVDEVVRGAIITTREHGEQRTLLDSEIQHHYRRWSSQTPDRLVRTPDRWRYWGLACRVCEPFLDGYVCMEPGLIREAVVFSQADKWPVPLGTEWYGLRSVSEACLVPVKRPKVELLFMTRGIPGVPQMFMTDQF